MQPQKSLCSSLRGEKFSCVWGPAVFAVRESNFPKWGRGQGYRRAQPCAQGWMVYGRRSPFFQLFFRLIFAAFALALIAGGKRDPARPCGTVRVPPRLFSLVVGNGGALGLPASFLFPSAGGGDSLSRSRGSCRHDSPPRPFAQGLCANFSTACSKVIFYYKWGNRDSEFPCCFGFSSRDRA